MSGIQEHSGPAQRPDAFPTVEELRAEEVLELSAFGENEAIDLGTELCRRAREPRLPVVIDIRTASRTLFHAALPGSSPDNAEWARRKSNCVLRFHRSSLLLGRELAAAGQSMEEKYLVDSQEYAPHGGSVPVRVAGVGVVAAVTVSGLPQVDDHRFVMQVLRDLAEGRWTAP